MPRKPGPPRRLDLTALQEYAVRSLAARGQSTAEMRRKLRLRAERPEDVDAVIEHLKDYGYLEDRKFAEAFAAARLDSKFGRNRVASDLRQRRVAPEVVDHSVQKVYEHVDEEALIEDFLRRKYRLAPRANLFQEEKDLAAAYRRLVRAGFSFGTIVRVLKRFAKNPELLDRLEPPEQEGAEE